ncbi:MAG TPA: hypothetical protein VFO42_08875 [Sphingomicrobium sp.]|nr:hypothetical protein [Sphingomicrobium sp.]
MTILPSERSDLASRAKWIAGAGWLILLLSAGAALLPMFERRGGAMVIGGLLAAAGLLEIFAGSLRHEARKLAMLTGALTVLAGVLFATGPATRFFLPAITVVMGWLVVRAVLLMLTSRLTGGGVRRWTVISAATDLLLALVLLVGLQIAALVVALIGATAPLVASFAWILALSFVATGLMLLEVASCARASEDV